MRTSNLNVVLLDDDTDLIEMLCIVLEDRLEMASFSVFTDPRAALEAVMLSNPDVIVSDLEMPFMTGMDFAQAVRNRPAPITAPLMIAMSGKPIKLANATELNLFDHSFLKPLDFDALAQLLQSR